MDIVWLQSFADAWRGNEERARLPHAVLLAGTPGVGKRAAAAWLAGRRLGIDPKAALPRYPVEVPEHPDLYRVRKPEDKHTIGIDQIRALVADLTLTSHGGGAKVAVIDPANSMTEDAANSLLKTLEEPPGDTLLVLIADRRGRLPATIFSRCQRMTLAVPPESVSLPWLERLKPSADWPYALRLAGGAPLAAIEALQTLSQSKAMAQDFAALPAGRASPLAVAARWAEYEPEFVLHWLSRQVQRCIHSVCGGAGTPPDGRIPESVLKRMDRRNLFCYLDTINRLRGQASGTMNVQLTLESLLIDWAFGLKDCNDTFLPGGLKPR